MSALRDLLDLPEEVTKSAFVIKLQDGVAHPKDLLASYVVTPSIANSFDQALDQIKASLESHKNNAAFIHGSFGSGKSHFMAVLSLMLAGDETVQRETTLHAVFEKHPWRKGKHLLRLHMNMIGASSIDERVFGTYLDTITKLHPDAETPPLFSDQALFDNAVTLRAQLGDEKFFAALSAESKETAGWGKLAAASTWNAERFTAACASKKPDERAPLFSALTKSLFKSFATQATQYLPFEKGLHALSQHAQKLGYDAVVFFLDELVLWLANRAATPALFKDELGKLTKFIEAQSPDQVIPFVTFAARQRDIADMVGEQNIGAESALVRDDLKLWGGRFGTISLDDRNLPAIVEKRVVRPKDDAARKRLDEAFVALRRGLGASWATLVGNDSDEKAFRQVYPFSPTLVQALVDMSSVLQRERTALKVLIDLLVRHLDDFELGKVVPIGDLYDALAGGDEPMDGRMRELFRAATRLYDNELLPVLRERHATTTPDKCQRLRPEHPVAIGCSNCAERACRTDQRLVKTVLLAALVPDSRVFKDLTTSRLVQLNHGTLRTPIPGQEAQDAATRLRHLASQLGKLRVEGSANDPTVRIVLEGVDLRPIIDQARGVDNMGARKNKLRTIVWDALSLAEGEPEPTLKHEWRGSKREGRVVYGNVREMPDERLKPRGDEDFLVVIDYPVDDAGHSPQEDEQRVATLRENQTLDTVVWLPHFLGQRAQRDLSDLVVIDHLLETGGWKDSLKHLSPADQSRAKDELQSLSSQKRETLRRAMFSAYGVTKAEDGAIDPSYRVEAHLHILRRGTKPWMPPTAQLIGALKSAVDTLFEAKHPRHPRFDVPPTKGKLEAELNMLDRLVQADKQRLVLEKSEAKALQFADALGLVRVLDGAAVIETSAFDELQRTLDARGVATPDVATVRSLVSPVERGLLREVQDFAICAFAIVRGRELVRGGKAFEDATLGKLPDDVELAQPKLPEEVVWQKSLEVAAKLFGVALSGRARNGRNLRELGKLVREKAAEARRSGAVRVSELLAARGVPQGAARRSTADAVRDLLDNLDNNDPLVLALALGSCVPKDSSFEAMRRHLVSASSVSSALENGLAFNSFAALERGESTEAKKAINRDLFGALRSDELHATLADVVRELALRAQDLLAAGANAEPNKQGPQLPPPAKGRKVVAKEDLKEFSAAREVEVSLARLRAAIDGAGEGASVRLSWEVVAPEERKQ